MNHFKFLHMAATLGITGFIYKSMSSKLNFGCKVNAQPKPKDNKADIVPECDKKDVKPEDDKKGIEFEDATCTMPIPDKCFPISSPVKIKELLFGPKNKSKDSDSDSDCHSPKVSDVKGYNFAVCRNADAELPNWTLQCLTKECVKSHHACPYCMAMRFPFMQNCFSRSDPEIKVGDYCGVDLDPCVFQAVPPQVERSEIQNNSLWDDFYHYLLYLTEKYKRVYVCSGPLFKTRSLTEEEKIKYPACESFKELTHFYKLIATEDICGLYRFEGFLFDNKPIEIEHPELSDYRVPKILVEIESCLSFFPDIKRRYQGAKMNNDDFIPHRVIYEQGRLNAASSGIHTYLS